MEREVGEDLRNLVTVEENLTVVDEEEPNNVKKKRDKGEKKGKGKASQKTKAEEDQEFLMRCVLCCLFQNTTHIFTRLAIS